MAKDNFAHALGEVLSHEGLWSDHPSDPGGATMKGVTLTTYRRYRPGATKAQLRAITDAELQRIYREGYWNAVRGDDLPAGLDLAVFDFAVNSGPDRAARALQTIVGVPVDGVIGPVTLTAISKSPASQIINELCARRLAFVQRLATFPTFGKGWSRRVAAVRAEALSMVAPQVPGAQPGSAPPERGRAPLIIITAIVLAALAAAFFLLPIFPKG